MCDLSCRLGDKSLHGLCRGFCNQTFLYCLGVTIDPPLTRGRSHIHLMMDWILLARRGWTWSHLLDQWLLKNPWFLQNSWLGVLTTFNLEAKNVSILRLARTGQDNLSSLAAVLWALRRVTYRMYKRRSSMLFWESTLLQLLNWFFGYSFGTLLSFDDIFKLSLLMAVLWMFGRLTLLGSFPVTPFLFLLFGLFLFFQELQPPEQSSVLIRTDDGNAMQHFYV